MGLASAIERFRTRADRRAYRAMVRQWYADGGDERFRFDYELTADSLAIDLGGYRGQWASDLFSRFQCRILIFEPVSDFAKNIRKRFEHNDKIRVFECALGASERTELIQIAGAGSSIHKRKRSATQTIQIIDVKNWFEDNAIDSVQLMKINIEGGEFELLERMLDTRLLQMIENIQVQFHNIAPDSADRMAAIQHSLRETHHPTYQYPFVWENWTRSSDER